MKNPTESRSSRDRSTGGERRESSVGLAATNGGGGIPRPHMTNSPSKLAVRTNTKLLAGGSSKHESNGGSHHSRSSTSNSSGEMRNGGGSGETSLRYGGSSAASGLVYKGGKTLVNDKLYPNR